MVGQTPRGSYSTGSSPAPTPDDGIPQVTWWICGLSVIVLVAAAVVFFRSPKSIPMTVAAPEATLGDRQIAPPPAALGIKRPLDLSDELIDAQKEASYWNPHAVLTSIELIVVDGAPADEIRFEFAEATGRGLPSAVVDARRFSVIFGNQGKRTREFSSQVPRRGLVEPNCPLEVALRGLGDLGVSKQQRIGVLLAHSDKHNRPVWIVTSPEGTSYQVDADSCAILRR